VLLHSYPDRFTHEFFIANANPPRPLVEQVWRALRSQADGEHLVSASVSELVARLPRTFDEQKTSAALRTLSAAGVLSVERASGARVWVRLLATPERITRELCGDRHVDREVLRSFWRAAGERLESGAAIDLDRLPSGLNGPMGFVPVLERLESGQFVSWRRMGGGFRLDPRSADPGWLPVDWASLDKRRQADLNRLDAVQRYSQTRACRRAFVLRYFGDPDARVQCDACDRCLGSNAKKPKRAGARDATSRSRL
jgi:ATP-dependent DNA helicase RecQ